MKTRHAFTMAEALITLAVIGILSTLIVTAINLNINTRINTEQGDAARYKLGKATEVMALQGKIKAYRTADEFVDEFQKFIQVNKRCTSANLEDCWNGNEKIRTANGKNEYDIKELTTGTQFMKPTTEFNDYSSPTVGLILGDGANLILGYNSKCSKMSPRTYSWIMVNNKPVYSETTSCMTGIMDINGAKGPNKMNSDIILVNANGIGTTCAFDQCGLCIGAPFLAAPINNDECESSKGSLGISECAASTSMDYWAGCIKSCGGIDKTASRVEAYIIYRFFSYNVCNAYNPDRDKSWSTGNGKYYAGLFEKWGFPSSTWTMWTSNEVSGGLNAYYREFYTPGSTLSTISRARSGFYCVCKM